MKLHALREFSAGGVVFRRVKGQIEIALILDPYDKWTFPKGRIEKGEKPEIAAAREVGEEIGVLNLKPVKLVDKIDYWYKRDKITYHKFVYFFLLEAKENTILKAQEEEIKDAKWFKPNKALGIVGYRKDDVPLLEKTLNILENLSNNN